MPEGIANRQAFFELLDKCSLLPRYMVIEDTKLWILVKATILSYNRTL